MSPCNYSAILQRRTSPVVGSRTNNMMHQTTVITRAHAHARFAPAFSWRI